MASTISPLHFPRPGLLMFSPSSFPSQMDVSTLPLSCRCEEFSGCTELAAPRSANSRWLVHGTLEPPRGCQLFIWPRRHRAARISDDGMRLAPRSLVINPLPIPSSRRGIHSLAKVTKTVDAAGGALPQNGDRY